MPLLAPLSGRGRDPSTPEPVGIGVSGFDGPPPASSGSVSFCVRFGKTDLSLGDDIAVIVELDRDLPLAFAGERDPAILVLVEPLDP